MKAGDRLVIGLLSLGVSCQEAPEVVEGISLSGDLVWTVPHADPVPREENGDLWSAERQLEVRNAGDAPVSFALPRQKLVVTSPGSRSVSWMSLERSDFEIDPREVLVIPLGNFGGSDPEPAIAFQFAVEIDGVLYPVTVRSEDG